jgi:hypothetical protein
MAECPRIVTYVNADSARENVFERGGQGAGNGIAPWLMIGPLWLARFVELVVNSKTREFSSWGFLPMVFEGDSEQAVIDAARKFWAEEAAKIEARRVNVAKARAARGPNRR